MTFQRLPNVWDSIALHEDASFAGSSAPDNATEDTSTNATADYSNGKWVKLDTDGTTDEHASVGLGPRRMAPDTLADGPYGKTVFGGLFGVDFSGSSGTWGGVSEGVSIGFNNISTYDSDRIAVFDLANNQAKVDDNGTNYTADLSTEMFNMNSARLYFLAVAIDWDNNATEFYIEKKPLIDTPTATIDHHPEENNPNPSSLRAPVAAINGLGNNADDDLLVGRLDIWSFL